MLKGQTRSTGFAVRALFNVCLYQVLTCAAEHAGLNPRQKAGADLLRVMSGQNLSDSNRTAKIASAIVKVPSPPAPKSWTALSVAAQQEGASAVAKILTSQNIVAPDVEQSEEHKCFLTFCETGSCFKDEAINSFIADLFYAVANAETPTEKVHLDRFDLFHAHLFLDYTQSDVGLVFHAREYPAYNQDSFPYILGYCQRESSMPYSPEQMDFRNFVWYKGQLVDLNTSDETILGRELLFPGTEIFRTVFEDELGLPVVDVFFFNSLKVDKTRKLFMCNRINKAAAQ